MANPKLPQKLPPKLSRYSFLIVVLISILMLSYVMKNPLQQKEDKISYSKFLEYADAKENQIKELKYMDTQSKIRGKLKDGRNFVVSVPKDSKSVDEVVRDLSKRGVSVDIEPPGWKENFGSIFYMIIIPAVLFIGLWFLIIRQANVGGSQAMSFGRSRAKLNTDDTPKITFKDVAGVDEAKEELEEVIEFLKDPKRFQEIGAKIPKGILMVGPPGSGKTLLARAVAGEAQVPFFHMSGSDFVEMFVGVGASRVRDLFDQAKKNSPCLVFIDEIDAVGRQRGTGLGGGHDEREQTLNQLLVEMDGFDPNVGVILIAATNRPDVLDPALLRPGRFDRRVVVDRPDVKGRRAILEVHARGKKISNSVDLGIVARRTPGFTGADLENVMNEAALLAARKNHKEIENKHLEEAIERNIAGPERKSRLLSDKARKITAYHEAGHALIARLMPDADPVHKISILPRGMALGYTLQVPLEDKYMTAKSELLDDICVLLGGRVAEELIFGPESITTGAANDLGKVKKIARKMVCEFGMTEKLGPITFGHKQDNVFLGRALAEDRDYSEEVASLIDEEIRNIVTSCYNKTETLLREHRDRLTLVADKLLEKEAMGGVLLESLLDGKDLPDEEIQRLEKEREEQDKINRAAELAELEKQKQEQEKESDDDQENDDTDDADHDTVELSGEAAPDPDDNGDAPDESETQAKERVLHATGNGLAGEFTNMLEQTLEKEYRDKIPDAAPGEISREAAELFFSNKDFENALKPIRQTIRECRDASVIPGLRIMLGLAHLKLGNVEQFSEELMNALMSAPEKPGEHIEQQLVGAISYFRILNEELKKKNLTLARLLSDATAVQQVDTRYREWEKRTGRSISFQSPAN